jgi:hypothetical protein
MVRECLLDLPPQGTQTEPLVRAGRVLQPLARPGVVVKREYLDQSFSFLRARAARCRGDGGNTSQRAARATQAHARIHAAM